ncbi:MAG: glutaminyl-peptide cyclotransferase, partial [Sediminibacterium sp.]|nr:glutaminyl-peptide cyclotransferase [Sediminibacterium sp.]
KIYPHDTASFTEGLFWLNNQLYESTGLKGTSYLLKANLETGKAIQKLKISNEYFGEGISMINNKIYMLTYQEHKVFVFDMDFKKIKEFEWPYEGWGMTTDGKQLILDTGGSNIYFINPETFKIERTLGVSNNNGYVDSINELEYVDGYLYANIWQTNSIIKIDPKTGIVVAKADLTDIFPKNNLVAPAKEGNCLNGIAYDAAKGSFYITGKYWPNLFEVKFH